MALHEDINMIAKNSKIVLILIKIFLILFKLIASFKVLFKCTLIPMNIEHVQDPKQFITIYLYLLILYILDHLTFTIAVHLTLLQLLTVKINIRT